ncbi:MAG: hypothetical protein AB1486_27090 [Planctomycetota bacterium]
MTQASLPSCLFPVVLAAVVAGPSALVSQQTTPAPQDEPATNSSGALRAGSPDTVEVATENVAYRLELRCAESTVTARLTDKATGLVVAEGLIVYRATGGPEASTGLEGAAAERVENRLVHSLVLGGKLARLDVEHTFALPLDKPIMEERIVITNRTGSVVAVTELEIGFSRRVSGDEMDTTSNLGSDRWIAVPFRHRATDPKGYVNDYSTPELLERSGWEPVVDGTQQYRQVPSRHHVSEGWAWLHGRHALGIFKFSQERLQFSVVSKLDEQTLRFGGACMISGEPAALTRLGPGRSVDLGGHSRQRAFRSLHRPRCNRACHPGGNPARGLAHRGRARRRAARGRSLAGDSLVPVSTGPRTLGAHRDHQRRARPAAARRDRGVRGRANPG